MVFKFVFTLFCVCAPRDRGTLGEAWKLFLFRGVVRRTDPQSSGGVKPECVTCGIVQSLQKEPICSLYLSVRVISPPVGGEWGKALRDTFALLSSCPIISANAFISEIETTHNNCCENMVLMQWRINPVFFAATLWTLLKGPSGWTLAWHQSQKHLLQRQSTMATELDVADMFGQTRRSPVNKIKINK